MDVVLRLHLWLLVSQSEDYFQSGQWFLLDLELLKWKVQHNYQLNLHLIRFSSTETAVHKTPTIRSPRKVTVHSSKDVEVHIALTWHSGSLLTTFSSTLFNQSKERFDSMLTKLSPISPILSTIQVAYKSSRISIGLFATFAVSNRNMDGLFCWLFVVEGMETANQFVSGFTWLRTRSWAFN